MGYMSNNEHKVHNVKQNQRRQFIISDLRTIQIGAIFIITLPQCLVTSNVVLEC